MDAESVARIIGGRLRGKNKEVRGFSFDSREVKEGELFVPIVSKRDGHEFIEDALKRGAVGSLTQRGESAPPEGKFFIEVKDTKEAFKRIARHKREEFGGAVVGITGSVGKTTTKELLFHLFSPFLSTYKNKKSFNNELGLTYTLSNLPPNTELYIQEVGTSSKGEIGALAHLLKPQIAVITAVKPAHMEGFGSLKELLEEKLSLTQGAEVAVVPIELLNLSEAKESITFGGKGADVELLSFKSSSGGSSFSVRAFGEKLSFKTAVPGRSVVNATLIALAVSKLLGIPLQELPELVESFKPPSGRMEIIKVGGTTIIDDSYNANPASMENAINVLKGFKEEKVAIIGQMLELGSFSEKEHKRVGELLNEAGVSLLLTVGEEARSTYEVFRGKKEHFESANELLEWLKRLSKEHLIGKAVLVKGSRSNRLEEAVKFLKEAFKS